ncbi:MAG TPA: hypothetical protein VJ140_07350 [Actinomycetota bacterium]|nr:hypothetical protein [Actinomycetota bacterium]
MTGLPYLIRVVVPTLELRRLKVPVRGMDLVEDRSLAPSRFTIATVLEHVERDGDPWKDLPRRRRSLGPARRRLDALVEQGG